MFPFLNRKLRESKEEFDRGAALKIDESVIKQYIDS